MWDVRTLGSVSVRQGCLVVGVIVQSAFLALLLAGHEPWAGPILFSVTARHGVHVADIPLVALWLVGLVAAATSWRSSSD